MKKLILLLAIFLSLQATKTYAQNGGDRMQQMQQQYRSFLKDSVQLNDAMIDAVMAIRQDYQPKTREIFMDQSASMEEKQEKIKALRTEMEGKYKTAGLTDAQVTIIHNHEEWMRQQMMNRRNNGGQ